jgi:hypothetical protein
VLPIATGSSRAAQRERAVAVDPNSAEWQQRIGLRLDKSDGNGNAMSSYVRGLLADDPRNSQAEAVARFGLSSLVPQTSGLLLHQYSKQTQGF